MENGNQIATATEQAVAELQTRFLHPFIFDRRRFQDASQALITAMVGEHRVWEGLRPRTEAIPWPNEPVSVLPPCDVQAGALDR